MRKEILMCVVLTCTMTATNASAQAMANVVKRVGIGGSVGGIFTTDDDVSAGTAVGLNVGLAPQHGFSPTIGFGWYSGDLTVPAAGVTEVGLRVRPLMGGVGYSWAAGRLAAGVSINAGISFNSIHLNDAFRALFPAGSQISFDTSNSFAARPQVRLEYEVARKAGVFTSLGYFYTKFDNVLNTPVGSFANEVNASSINVFVGVMVYPFR